MQFVEGKDQVSNWIRLTSDLCLRLFWLGTYRIMSKRGYMESKLIFNSSK